MQAVAIPFTPARVELTLPFGFLPTGLRTAALFVLLAGLVVLLGRLYRVELNRVSVRAARALLGLRAAAVAAVFLVWTAEPVVVEHRTETPRGRVLVAVDVSDSMRVIDRGRPSAEAARITRALRFPDEGAVGRLTRLQLAAWVLDSYGAALLERLRGAHAVELVAFGQTLTELPLDSADLPDALATRSPATAFTDLKQPLLRAAAGDPDAPLVGVVLLTDGRHNWGEPPGTAAAALRERGVPVFPVNVAAREPSPDVAVTDARPAVSTALRNSTVPVTVRVRATHWPAGPITVRLSGVGDTPLTQTVPHDGTDREYEVTFHPRLDRAGPQTLTAEATPAVPDPVPENNSRPVRVTVTDDRPRVLLVDGEARWEFRYQHGVLTRSKDPAFDVKAVVFRQPRIGDTPDAQAEKLGIPALKLPAGPDALAGFDCIVLGDPTAEQLPLLDRGRLEKYVADGGTLVVVAGKRFIPVGLADTAADAGPLRKLLPIRDPRALTPPVGFRPQLTADGARAGFLRLGDLPAENAKAWADLSPLGWGAIGTAKDGAEVLAWVNDPAAGAATERTAALIARQHYGFGRVLYVGTDGIWRWRRQASPDLHARFWKQVAQWAAADRLLPAQDAAGTIRFGPREAVYSSGQPVTVLLRVSEMGPKPPATAGMTVKVIRTPDSGPETVVTTAPFATVEGRPREFAATLPGLPPGRYAVEPDIPEWAGVLRTAGGLRAGFEVTPPTSQETTELSPDLATLRELAGPDGRVYELAEVAELIDTLAARRVTRESDVRSPLDRSWWTLGLVALLLTAEWVVRKRSGLA